MSGVTLTGNLDRFRKRLDHIAEPPAAAKDQLGKVAVDQGGFASNYEGNPLGWDELKPETIRRKGHARILYQTGAMMHSYGYRITPYGIQAFNKDPKGAIHQKTRPHLVLRPEVRQRMWEAYMRELLK
jgi:hypothetical protein